MNLAGRSFTAAWALSFTGFCLLKKKKVSPLLQSKVQRHSPALLPPMANTGPVQAEAQACMTAAAQWLDWRKSWPVTSASGVRVLPSNWSCEKHRSWTSSLCRQCCLVERTGVSFRPCFVSLFVSRSNSTVSVKLSRPSLLHCVTSRAAEVQHFALIWYQLISTQLGCLITELPRPSFALRVWELFWSSLSFAVIRAEAFCIWETSCNSLCLLGPVFATCMS